MKDDLAMGARRMAETYAHLTHLSALLGECADEIERLRETNKALSKQCDILETANLALEADNVTLDYLDAKV